jgi:hypothetical protein
MPTRSCVVPGCLNIGQTLYKFPDDRDLRAKWVSFVVSSGVEANFVVKQCDRVCKLHFSSDDFANYGAFMSGHCSQLTLNRNAVPHCHQPSAGFANPFAIDCTAPTTEELQAVLQSDVSVDVPASSCQSTFINVCKKRKLSESTRCESTQCDFFTLQKLNMQHKSTSTDKLVQTKNKGKYINF